MMAAIGAQAVEFMSPALLCFLLLLFIFLTALCSDCGRRSFELKDSEVEKNPSALIRVVKLEEARENPMIDEIRSDEKEFPPDVSVTPWRSHLGAPHSRDLSGPERIYHTITEGRGINGAPSPPANQQQADSPAAGFSDQDRNSVYARVSKKLSSNIQPVHRAEEEEEEEEEEASPPLPDRSMEEEG